MVEAGAAVEEVHACGPTIQTVTAENVVAAPAVDSVVSCQALEDVVGPVPDKNVVVPRSLRPFD
jgi:hypothetical protein